MIPVQRGADRVVVAVDGSWQASAALHRATAEATARLLPLEVVHLLRRPADPDLGLRAQVRRDDQERRAARDHLDQAIAWVRDQPDAPAVTWTLVDEERAGRLDDLMAGCRLLVLGSRGETGRRAFVIGSASHELARAVTAPVLVVPDTPAPPDGPVLVAIDASRRAATVLAVAVQEARRRDARLEVVHAYRAHDDGQALEQARQVCAEALARVDTAGLEVNRVVTAEPAADAVLARCGTARLTVVGSRGPFALAGLAVGSVSRAVLAAAQCPVLVVPVPAATRERPEQVGAPADIAPA